MKTYQSDKHPFYNGTKGSKHKTYSHNKHYKPILCITQHYGDKKALNVTLKKDGSIENES